VAPLAVPASADPLSWEEAQSFVRLAEDNDRLGDLGNDPFGDWLPSVLPVPRGRALDLGCGAGRHAVLLADWFDQVDAVHLSGPMIRLARRKRPRQNVCYLESGNLDASFGQGRPRPRNGPGPPAMTRGEACPSTRQGAMFWLRWNRLSGSYLRLTSTSRS
jgi:SAM-dependent methyltransferase